MRIKDIKPGVVYKVSPNEAATSQFARFEDAVALDTDSTYTGWASGVGIRFGHRYEQRGVRFKILSGHRAGEEAVLPARNVLCAVTFDDDEVTEETYPEHAERQAEAKAQREAEEQQREAKRDAACRRVADALGLADTPYGYCPVRVDGHRVVITADVEDLADRIDKLVDTLSTSL